MGLVLVQAGVLTAAAYAVQGVEQELAWTVAAAVQENSWVAAPDLFWALALAQVMKAVSLAWEQLQEQLPGGCLAR